MKYENVFWVFLINIRVQAEMLLWIGELQEIYILVASSQPLSPYHCDIKFTSAERNRKPLSSPLVSFSQHGIWSLPKFFTYSTPDTDQVSYVGALSFPQVSIELHRPHFPKEFEKVIQTSELNLFLTFLVRPSRTVAIKGCILSWEDRKQGQEVNHTLSSLLTEGK